MDSSFRVRDVSGLGKSMHGVELCELLARDANCSPAVAFTLGRIPTPGRLLFHSESLPRYFGLISTLPQTKLKRLQEVIFVANVITL
jgi:hypothetical protein